MRFYKGCPEKDIWKQALWVSRAVMLQGTALEKDLMQSVLGVFEAQEESLNKQSKRGKGIGNYNLVG